MPAGKEHKHKGKKSSESKKGAAAARPKLNKDMIGAPTDFQHLTHVGLDSQFGVDVRSFTRHIPATVY